MKEQLLKTSGADVLSPRKRLRKTLLGDGIPPPPPPLYVRGLNQPSLLFVSYVANGHDDGEHNDDNVIFMKKITQFDLFRYELKANHNIETMQ